MNSFHISKEVKKEIESLYHQKLEELSLPYEFLKIETTFADTNVVITGAKQRPSLVLLHGTNACAPLAIEAMMDLVNDFRIYAVDIPGQPNLSDEFRLNKNDNSYGKWMYEILSRLGLRDAFLVGISLGGFIALKTLVFDEKRIARVFLISPAGIVNGKFVELFLKLLLPLKRYRTTKNLKYFRLILEELFSEKDEFSEAFLSNVFLNYRMDCWQTPLISENEAKQIKTPLHIFAAENDWLFPGQKIARQAHKIFPLLNEVVLIGNSKHVPSKQDHQRIVKIIGNSIGG